MSPDEEVNVTLTREEAMRIHGALRALCDLHKMMPEMPSALRLTDAVEVIERVLPRLRACFPDDETAAHSHMEKHGSDVKSYSNDPFTVKINDLPPLSSTEAAAIFATEYDPAIKGVLQSLDEFTDFSKKDFDRVMDELKLLMVKTMQIPHDLSVQDSQPYVQASDLMTLGAMAYEMYVRQDQINDQMGKPF